MSRRLLTALAAAVAMAALTAPGALAAPQLKTFVIYAKPVTADFVNHNDDRQRGDIVNPFTDDVLPTPPNANSSKKGTRAGDNGFFTFKLFSDAKLTQAVGTAIYSCTFNFAQEAICTADFQLGKGTMVASGPAKLDGSSFVIPVTGGTGSYASAHGQLTSTTASNKSTRVIRFQLV